MLALPDGLTTEAFLAQHWQKSHLFMPGALSRLRPAITRNELAWLATLDDVESRIVFTERTGQGLRYRVENGPFVSDFLKALPKRDWTLLVHDVEKHLPAMRALLAVVPFVPDWRIDDLMVSFAAPGGSVGPHKDHYDVFLCQGTGVREWHVTTDDPGTDHAASADLALLREFEGVPYEAREGDVLYVPPGVPHWGIAQRACLTYSIGMRAPQLPDLATTLPDADDARRFYADADLSIEEALPGYISPRAVQRALTLLGLGEADFTDTALTLGRYVTTTKEWLTPETATESEAELLRAYVMNGGRLEVHGMARIAWDASHIYVNGRSHTLDPSVATLVEQICRTRCLTSPSPTDDNIPGLVEWMLRKGAFEIPGNL